MSLSYGQIGEETKRIKSIMKRISALGENKKSTVDDLLLVLEDLNAELSDSDDIFIQTSKKLLGQILKDGVISNEEHILLSQYSLLYDNPVSDAPICDIKGKSFVLTGDFETAGGKATIKDMIIAAGGIIKSSTSRKVSYVVVGGLGSDAWAFGGFGQKIKKALDLKLTGQADIEIVSEKALLSFFEDYDLEAMTILEKRKNLFSKQWASPKAVSPSFDGLTHGQKKVFDLVERGENVYLTGLGGTGKSYVLDRIIEWGRSKGKNIIVCAPTGIAALNIGGSTIHRVLGISPQKPLQMKHSPWIAESSPLLECDLMIVDEISMCRMDLFDYLSLALKKSAKKRKERKGKLCQLVVVGDFCQLPPVVRKDEKIILDKKYGFDVGNAYPFQGKEWDSWSFSKIELTEAIRQRDIDFVAALNACRVGDSRGLHWIEEHASKKPAKKAIVLCGRNADANQVNEKKLAGLSSPLVVYEGKVSGNVDDADLPTSKRLRLKNGARVMALVNNTEDTYMNGSLGNVVECKDSDVVVSFDNGVTTSIGVHKWEVTRPILFESKTKLETVGTFTQIPLKLAYSITIHKSQGQTFEAASIYPQCWDPGQLYTAVSRLTSVEGLHFVHRCPDSSLITSPEVLEFIEAK